MRNPASSRNQVRWKGPRTLRIGASAILAGSTAAIASSTISSGASGESSAESVPAPAAPVDPTVVTLQSPQDLAAVMGTGSSDSYSTSFPSGVTANDVNNLTTKVSEQFGDRYAGFWLDRSSATTRIVFGLVGSQQADTAYIDSVAGSNVGAVRLANVTYSAEQLEQYSSAIAQSGLLGSTGSSSINYAQNRIEIVTSVSDQAALNTLIAGIKSIVPGGAVQINQVQSVSYSTSAYSGGSPSRSTFPPYKGGLAVTDGIEECTTAFYWNIGSNDYGSTAGHCFAPGDGLWIPGSSGSGEYETIGGAVSAGWPTYDLNLIGIVNTDDSDMTATVYQSSGNFYNVTGVMHFSNFGYDEGLCWSGISSGEACADLVLEDESAPGGPQGLYCMNRVSIPGDSGAPVYKGNGDGNDINAGGIMSGNLTIEIGGEATTYGCFTPVDYMTQETGATVHLVG